MLPDSRASIFGPPGDWGQDKFTPPAFESLHARRSGLPVSLSISVSLHLLSVLILPVVLRALPDGAGETVRAQMMPAAQAALILRMPDRIYLPLHASHHGPASGAGAAPGVSGTSPANAGQRAAAPDRPAARRLGMPLPVLLQPGKPAATDPRLMRLPSLLYLTQSQPPAPEANVEPAARAASSPAAPVETPLRFTAATGTAVGPVQPDSTAAPATAPPAIEPPPANLVPPDRKKPAGAEEGQQGKREPGENVAVVAIASAPPRAKQVVEVPAISQPVHSKGPAADEPAPGVRGGRRDVGKGGAGGPGKGAVVGGASGGNGKAASVSAAVGEGTRGPQGNHASRAGQHNPGGNSTKPAPAREASSAPAGPVQAPAAPAPQAASTANGATHVRDTPLGRALVHDLPSGAQQWQFPTGGAFDVVIVQPSPGATIPDAEQLLTGRPVQTVYLTLGTGQDWVLQYCLPAAATAPVQSGMVVSLGGPDPKLDAPFILQALVPPARLLQNAHTALFQGALDVNGRFVRLHPVADSHYKPAMDLLPYLEQWQFRPAKLDRVATEVEVLLLVPPPPGE